MQREYVWMFGGWMLISISAWFLLWFLTVATTMDIDVFDEGSF